MFARLVHSLGVCALYRTVKEATLSEAARTVEQPLVPLLELPSPPHDIDAPGEEALAGRRCRDAVMSCSEDKHDKHCNNDTCSGAPQVTLVAAAVALSALLLLPCCVHGMQCRSASDCRDGSR